MIFGIRKTRMSAKELRMKFVLVFLVAVFVHTSYARAEDSSAHIWLTQTIDSGAGNGVGGYPSIVLDSNDQPHISYHEYGAISIKYAVWDGSDWSIQTVTNCAQYQSLALDSNNRPHISYYTSDFCGADLRYAYWDGASWNFQVVDSNGSVGKMSSLALDSNDKPHISYYDETNKDLKYAYWNGSSWDINTVDVGVVAETGTSLALDSNDNPRISYREGSGLKYAAWSGTGWTTEVVDGGSVGSSSSLRIDGNDNPHISYHADVKDLKYAIWNGSSWNIQTVDGGEGDQGMYTSLALDSFGNPRIAYMYNQQPNCVIKYASWKGLEWDIEYVDTQPANMHPSLALDSNDFPHICYYNYNYGNPTGSLKHASVCKRAIIGDLNRDCYVDFRDFAVFAADWLDCANPFDPDCTE